MTVTSRAERDQARIRCLAAAISSLHCEMARVIQASEDPERLEAYAHENLSLNDTEEELAGLDMKDLADLIGSMAAMEKLIELGAPAAQVRAMVVHAKTMDPSMARDLDLYLEGISSDRPAAEGSCVEA